jgi:hypothetical protein
MGNNLEECKSDLFPIGKIVDRKISFEHIQTFFYNVRIYQPSNNGISKFTCTLKGVACLLDEGASPVGSRQRIYMKFSIIFSFATRGLP